MGSPLVRHWYDVRVLGPALLLLFGLVLVFAPALAISPSGTVGNAGVHLKDPPPNGDGCPDDEGPSIQGPGGGGGVHLNGARSEGPVGAGGGTIGLPPNGDDCPPNGEDCVDDAPPPGGGGGGVHVNGASSEGPVGVGNAGGQPPQNGEDCPDEDPDEEVTDPVDDPVEPPAEEPEVPGPEVGGEVEEAPAASVEPITELPYTGSSSSLALVAGVAFVALGAVGLLAARRRTA